MKIILAMFVVSFLLLSGCKDGKIPFKEPFKKYPVQCVNYR